LKSSKTNKASSPTLLQRRRELFKENTIRVCSPQKPSLLVRVGWGFGLWGGFF